MRLLLPVVLVALGAACGPNLPELPVVDDPCATWPRPGLYVLPLEGWDREPMVQVPATPGPRPAIVALHGAQRSGTTMMRETTTFRNRADAEGYVAVFPDGSGSPTGWTWNAGSCCGISSETGLDDLGFLEAMGKELRRRLCVDRIVATGHSNGGMMAMRWACEGTQADAVMSSAGPLVVDACPGAPFPVTMVRGTDDLTVPIDGSVNDNGTAFPSQQDDVDAMLDAQACTGEPEARTVGDTTCLTWFDCDTQVRSCTIEGGGHVWPGEAAGVAGFEAESEAEALIGLASPHR